MKQLYKNLFFIIIIFSLYACTTEKNNVERLLSQAGANRSELEKVLSYYQEDSLKYKAAVFLIENMPFHSYLDGPELMCYRKYYECANGNYIRLNHILDSLNGIYGTSFLHRLQRYNDLKSVSSTILIHHIDWAFKVWQEQPWGKKNDFDDFCEYILPYRIGDEPPSCWREGLYAKYNPILDHIRTLPEGKDPFFVARVLLDSLVQAPITFTGLLPAGPHLGPDIVKWRSGTCRELADVVNYVFRSVGLPSTTDFVVRGDNNANHLWNVLIGEEKKVYQIEMPGIQLMPVDEYKAPKAKVHRATFSLNRGMVKEMNKRWTDIYPIFRFPMFLDVTSQYAGKWNQTVSINTAILYEEPSKKEIVYLCLSNRREWIPVDWTCYQKDNLTFQNIEGHVVFRLGVWRNLGLEMISDPFLLEKETGNLRFFYPARERDTLSVYYKMNLFSEEFTPRMLGGAFEGSNDPGFRNKDTLFLVTEAPHRLYNTIYPDKATKKYRYIRYKGGMGSYCNIAEIEFYAGENDSIPLAGRMIGTPGCYQQDGSHEFTNAFDGDPYTSFDYLEASSGWTGLDLGVPRSIGKIRYVPRNRDNFIRKDDQYELFYWENRRWNSDGIKQAEADSLLFVVPKNALLYLKNHTRGSEERIFSYENGKQIFW